MIHWEFGLVGSKLGALASVDEFMQVKSQQRPAYMALLFRLCFGFLELPQNVNPHLPLQTCNYVNAAQNRQWWVFHWMREKAPRLC